eukprot:jgi/Psemu1/212518/e_gw1.603.10.1
MQGRGVTNFSTERPSHGYTTRTTEFDDELIKRGIVTTEQVMMAKGASAEEAVRLVAEEKKKQQREREKEKERDYSGNWMAVANGDNDNDDNSDDNNSDDSDFLDDDDDDAFLQRYRRERLEQMKKEHDTKQNSELALLSRSSNTKVLHISRDQWKEHVNEASVHGWVIVTLGQPRQHAGDGEYDDEYDDEYEYNDGRRRRRRMTRLRTIDASAAIPNWPEERVPAMFAYRDGVKQHEWIASRRGEFPSRDLLEGLFRRWSVIQ